MVKIKIAPTARITCQRNSSRWSMKLISSPVAVSLSNSWSSGIFNQINKLSKSSALICKGTSLEVLALQFLEKLGSVLGF